MRLWRCEGAQRRKWREISKTFGLALRLAIDALAGLLVFAGVCGMLKLDEYLYIKDLLRRAFLRGMSFIRARPLYRSR